MLFSEGEFGRSVAMNISSSGNGTLRVVMSLSFGRFDDDQRSQYLADLSEVLGCSESDVQATAFRRGCVIGETKIDEAAIRLLLELIQRNTDGTLTSSSPEVRSFLAKYNVRNVTADLPAPFHIAIDKTPKQQIVFVHGWRSNAATFGDLPGHLDEMFSSRVEPFSYPTSLAGHSPSIFHLARGLENHIRTYVSADQVAIVAHSMGGLVTRKMLVMQRDRSSPLDNAVKQVTLIASPNLGSDFASILKRMPGFGSEQLSELSPNSGFVVELHEQWQNWKIRKTPVSCKIRCMYGTNDGVVPSADASSDDTEAVPMLGADHSDIVKPAKRDSVIVATLARFMREAGFKSYLQPEGGEGERTKPSM